MRSFVILCLLLSVASAQQPPKEEPKKEKKEKKLPPRPDTPIVKLEKAWVADRKDRQKLIAVYDALIRLDNWYFIWRPDDANGHPRIITTEGKNLVQCFSDREQAVEVAEYNGLDAKDVRAIPVAKAARMLANLASEEITDSVWDIGRVDNAMTMELKQYPVIYKYHLKKDLP